jgi:PAS domain S-box-containing protein
MSFLNGDKDKSTEETRRLREELEETRQVLDAIRNGHVDALVVPGPEGDQIYTLQGADQSYRFMIETMNEGALVVSKEGLVLYCNRQFSEMLDVSVGTIMGSDVLDLVPQPERKAFEEYLKRAHQEAGIKAETRIMTGRRQELPVRVSMRHFSFDSFNAICVVVMDLTDTRNKEALLRENARALQEKNAELHRRAMQLSRLSSELAVSEQRERRRLAKILHDNLQQLLVGARFNLEILEGRVTEENWKPIENAIDLIVESIEASRSLAIELSPPVLHESGLIPALEWLIRWTEKKQGLTVTLEEHGGSGYAVSDDLKIALFSAVRELLLNIVKHAGAMEARVNVSFVDNDTIKIAVSDRGAGFDPARILSEPGEHHTGLGLCSLAERFQMMGGQLLIDSALGKGTTVTICAPVSIKPAAEVQDGAGEKEPLTAGGTAMHAEEAAARKEKTGIRVMLVDDHDMVRQGLSMLLSGYPDIEVVGEVSDGESAVELARKLNPDVILMDISMPKMNGIEATRVIHSENPEINIIGLSMFDASEQAESIKKAGARAYLKKNVSKNDLLNMVRNMV